MSDTTHEKRPMSDAERRRKANAKRVFLRAGVLRDDYAPDHPVRQMLDQYESMKGRSKSDWLLDLLLVGYEFDRHGLSEGLATMVRNRTVDAAGGVILAADKLHKLHGGQPLTPVTVQEPVKTPTVAPAVKQPVPVTEAVESVGDEETALSQDDIDMGFG